jgi:response regulator RpfG family c-di-GMP phosphodiesterase
MELKKRDNPNSDTEKFDKYYDFLFKLNTKGFITNEEVELLNEIKKEQIINEEDYICLSVKKGNLTAEELKDMQSHVSKSSNMLEKIPWPGRLKNVPNFAGTHHEKINGNGYPNQLSGDAITVEARILAIADIYDALTAEDRPYKPAIPHDKAKNIIEFMVKDNELDNDLVDIFFENECYNI